MKAMLLSALFSFALVTMLPAKTCREVVRDASGRIVQTIERQKQAGGTERAVIRDASGRVTGTATTQASVGSTTRTQYRDASGRSAGSATTQGYASGSSGSSRTTYRDASGRAAGSADTSKVAGTTTRTQFRDASGRSAGSETTSGGASGTYGMEDNNGSDAPAPGTVTPIHDNTRWKCSDKQKDLILKLVDEHNLDKNEVDHLACQRFGKGVKQLSKLEASGLIDELLDTYGGNSRPAGNNTSNRRNGTAYSRNGRRDAA